MPQKNVEEFKTGKKAGTKWVKQASYTEVGLEVNPCSSNRPDLGSRWTQDELTEIRQRKILIPENLKGLDWAKGFLCGVQEFWDKVKDRLSDQSLKVEISFPE